MISMRGALSYGLWLERVPTTDPIQPLFRCATLALLAFCVSWSTKGQVVFGDLKSKEGV